jgi:hypothetical protein
MFDIKTWATNKLNDQDFMQKLNVATIVCFELYRSIISSFLILFVPQKCGDHLCNINENLSLDNELYSAGIVFNFMTMFLLVFLYFIEVKRENKLITYLEVNKSKAFDNDSVYTALENIATEKRNSIYFWDKCYQIGSHITIACFVTNATLSGIVIYNYYLDDRTTTTFVTNLLFMIMKLMDVQNTVNSEKNIFYSAYLKTKIQYNDVDPDKMLQSNNVDNFYNIDIISIENENEAKNNSENIENIENSENSDNSDNSENIENSDCDEIVQEVVYTVEDFNPHRG